MALLLHYISGLDRSYLFIHVSFIPSKCVPAADICAHSVDLRSNVLKAGVLGTAGVSTCSLCGPGSYSNMSGAAQL